MGLGRLMTEGQKLQLSTAHSCGDRPIIPVIDKHAIHPHCLRLPHPGDRQIAVAKPPILTHK
jgi:hypothetical protein